MKKNKLGYYFIQEFLKNYLSILFAFGLIIWITQAVRLLDLIGEEGNSTGIIPPNTPVYYELTVKIQ